MEVWQTVVVPVALGLLGFVEPCAIGAHSVFVGYLRGRPRPARLADAAHFALARAVVFGLLGLGAGLLGQFVVGLRGSVNVALGLGLVVLGVAYAGSGGKLWSDLRPLARLLEWDRDRALPLGLATGLSLPACATPLVIAAVAGGVSGAGLFRAFLSLFLFGMALSLPLAAFVLYPPAMETLARTAARVRRLPWLTGALIAVLGVFMVLLER